VLISSFYITSFRTPSLRPVRVPSDQNTRWRLPFKFFNDKRQEFLVSLYLPDRPYYIFHGGWTIAATSYTCDNHGQGKLTKNEAIYKRVKSFHKSICFLTLVYVHISDIDKLKKKIINDRSVTSASLCFMNRAFPINQGRPEY
jgi:hypothetical protein